MNDAAADPFTLPPRTVRPRTRTYKRLPVVVIAGTQTLAEDGQVGRTIDLAANLPELPPTLFVRIAAADFVAQLDARYRELDTWQWRASSADRDIIRPSDGARVATQMSTAIHFFGFKGGSYHKIIDPITMYGHGLDKIWPGEESQIYRLLQWGIALRDFCHDNHLQIRPTTGSISSQFLTDRRFYPHSRRKVPMAINARAREALPGNHYMLTVAPTPHGEHTARYLDQHRAHHYHAQTTPLPASDHLYAYGRFADLAEITFSSVWPDFYGLYCLDLQSPTCYRRSHWLTKLDRALVFSNELSHLTDMGYQVNGVYAAWGSFQRDAGLSKYAKWAQQQLDHYGDKPWLKPLLLSTYGTLAIHPTVRETVFRLAKNGEPVTLLTGHHNLSGTMVRAVRKLEPGIANVIHRGMIEAATRSESVGFAQHLTFLGYRVLSIYADAVMIEDDPDKPLPPMIEPWRCKTKLNHLQFVNQQAFVSGEMTRLPGISRELRDYRQHSPGRAPRKIIYEAITGKPVHTNRRI